MNIDNW